MADTDNRLAGAEGADGKMLSDEIEALNMYDQENGVHVQLADEVRKLEAALSGTLKEFESVVNTNTDVLLALEAENRELKRRLATWMSE